MGKGWLIGGAAALAATAALVWAWLDGGERPLAPREAPAVLPRIPA